MAMIDLSWQKSIERLLFDNNFNKRILYKWNLPRMVGVTTFLVELANDMSNSGKIILFISGYRNLKNQLSTNLDFIRAPLNPLQVRGKSYDAIFIDTVDLNDEEISILKPCVTSKDGFILWLNSTEGTTI